MVPVPNFPGVLALPQIMNIQEAWNEAEELNTSLRELNDFDLLDCRQSLIDRTNIIMEALCES